MSLLSYVSRSHSLTLLYSDHTTMCISPGILTRILCCPPLCIPGFRDVLGPNLNVKHGKVGFLIFGTTNQKRCLTKYGIIKAFFLISQLNGILLWFIAYVYLKTLFLQQNNEVVWCIVPVILILRHNFHIGYSGMSNLNQIFLSLPKSFRRTGQYLLLYGSEKSNM